MLSKHLKTALSLLLTGIIAVSGTAVSAGAVSQSTSDIQSAAASTAASKLYLANNTETIPDGRYFFYNIGTGTVMTDQLEASNNSFPSYLSGFLDEAVRDTVIPDKYFYTVKNQGNGNYTIQNGSGQYLDIVGYGKMRFTSDFTALKFNYSNTDGIPSYQISKTVDGKTECISMWENEWFTVHDMSGGSSSQLMRLYREETSSDLGQLLAEIDGIFDPKDSSMQKFNSGVTAYDIKDMVSRAAAYQLPKSYEFKLSRADDIVDGKAIQNYTEFIPARNGKIKSYADQLNKPWFATERQSTGIWTSPGEQFTVYVEAGANDPLPTLLFTQHISNNHEEKSYVLKRGANVITTPTIHADFSNYETPDVEPGGLFYVINPYTKDEQSSNVKLYIFGGDKVPTFNINDDPKAFLESIKDYYTHYKNGEKGYHNCVELISKYSFMTITLEKTVEAYVKEGLSPTDTMKNWDSFIEYLMKYDGVTPEQYSKLKLGVKVNQPYAGAYATTEMICIQDNNWLASFLASRYGWGFPHEVGHTLDDQTRVYVEVTNNMWSMKYVLEHGMFDSICVSKENPYYDIKLIAPPDQNSFWLDEVSGSTHYFWQLFMFWDLEVYHNGYWAAVDTMFRNKSCGNSAIDNYLNNCSLKEKFAAYSSMAVGNDMTYYFRKYGYLKNESSNYTTAISMMNLGNKTPKIYYYGTDTYCREKISNAGKGSIELSSYNPDTRSMYFSVPAACVPGHLGFEIVKDGKVVDFIWGNEYIAPSSGGTYTVNAYDTQLNVYSSITFDTNSSGNKYTASVNGTYYKNISEAINAAPSGGTVYLHGSSYINSTINISKAVTLKSADGSKQIVIMNNQTSEPAFRLTAGGSLTVNSYNGSSDNMVVFDNYYHYVSENNYTSYPFFDISGGAYLELGKGVTVQNCYSSANGSVAAINASRINLNGCIIQSNRAWYTGTFYLKGGSSLTSSNGTLFKYNRAKTGAAVFCETAGETVNISNTEICYNYNNDQDGSTISLSAGTLDVGSGTSIHGNADGYYSVNSAMYIGDSGKVTFSGKLNITDNVTVSHSVSVSPSVTGKLCLRADRTHVGTGFVLAVPSSGQFTESTYKAMLYKHNLYHLAWNASSFYISDKTAPKATVALSSYSIYKGKSVTIRCSASEGSAPYQYKIDVRHSSASSYTTIKDFSTASTKTWTPALTGSYTVRVTVTDSGGMTSTDAHTLKVNAVIAALRNTSTLSVSSLTVGGAVRVNCSVTGGVKPYKYAVYYKKSTDKYYKTLKALNTVNTVAFKPASTGSYSILVKAVDSRGVSSNKTLALTVKAKYVAPLTNNSSISPSVIELGKAVKINCAASGGTAPYKYAVYYKKSSARYFTTLRKASTLTSAAFKPATAGRYIILVKAADSKGNTKSKQLTLTVKAPLKNSSTISYASVVLGSSVTVKANASGGTSPYKYAYYYKRASSRYYSPVKNYSTVKSVNIKPAGTGKYTVLVRVKDAKGTVAGKTFTVNVTAPLKNSSSISADTITIGKTITIKGKASGGSAPYMYAFYYKKSTSSAYTRLRNYSIATTAAFKPASSGKYSIIVIVKDNKGSFVRKLFTLNVRAKLANKSAISSASLTLGKSFTVTAAASGGAPAYRYAVYYKKAASKAYTAVRGFSTSKTIKVKPKAVGKYNILVTVKDSEGSLARKVFTVTVKAPLKNKSTISAARITLGKSVVIKAAGYGGTSPYQYSVYYKKSTKTAFSELRSYSASNKITFKPVSKGIYTLRVKVKDAKNKIAAKDLTLKVV